jgi:hypothetical protein
MKIFNNLFSHAVLTLSSLLWACVVLAADVTVDLDTIKDKPTNPFDYNFCGGERVYPIVGVNIATACGPRNQIALGRRGKISWFYPAHGSELEKKGSYPLTDEALAKLSLLAEVVMVSNSQQLDPGSVIYKMGINFSARKPAHVHAPLTDKYTPGNKLLQAMQTYVPDKLKLPECKGALSLFDPTMRMEERLQLIKSANKLAGQELEKQ